MQSVDNAAVGALDLPIAAGSEGDALTDPVVEGIADFLGWMLRHDLDAKLANLPATSATAVKAANVYTFDPMHPRGHSVKRPVPALYVWWDGTSSPWPVSQIRTGRKRTIQALYIFNEHPALDEMNKRRGLFAAVDACFARAADQGGHPDYAYGNAENGELLRHSIGDDFTWGWRYLHGQEGSIRRVGIDDPETDMRPRKRRMSGRDWPAFLARFEVEEIIQPNTDNATVTADSEIDITNDDFTAVERILEYDAG